MVRAEARAGHRHAVVARAGTHQRQNFVDQVVVVLNVPPHAVRRALPLRVPALGIDAVHAEQHDLAILDLPADGVHHAAVLVLVERAHRGRENQHRHPAVPEQQQLHVTAQTVAVPLVIFAIHLRVSKGISIV